MNKILIIARREFLETIKTKAFLFGVIFMPGLILAAVYGAGKLTKVAEQEVLPLRRIAVLDRHGRVYEELGAQIENFNQKNPQRKFELVRVENEGGDEAAAEKSLAEKVRNGAYYAYIVIPREAVAGQADCLLGRKDSQLSAGRTLRQAINSAVIAVRFKSATPPVDMAYVDSLRREVEVDEIDVQTGKKGEGDQVMARMMTPFAFMFLLYMGTFGISMGLLTSVLEEKSTRVVEVLLAAVSPMQLMAGKILGMVTVGVLVLAVWLGVGYASAKTYNMVQILSAYRLMYVALYFVPGFLFMASLLAAIGSVCNTLKEAQSMSSPLTILNIVPMVLWFPLTQGPNSALAVTLSYIPPITPFVMILRICADPDIPKWQIISTLAMLWAAVIFMIWAAGKIFHVGILMYGKPPSLRELGRWLRYA